MTCAGGESWPSGGKLLLALNHRDLERITWMEGKAKAPHMYHQLPAVGHSRIRPESLKWNVTVCGKQGMGKTGHRRTEGFWLQRY